MAGIVGQLPGWALLSSAGVFAGIMPSTDQQIARNRPAKKLNLPLLNLRAWLAGKQFSSDMATTMTSPLETVWIRVSKRDWRVWRQVSCHLDVTYRFQMSQRF